MTGANFVRTRENMQEFSGMARVVKSLRKGTVLMGPITDNRFRFRAGDIATRVKKLDIVSLRGQRVFDLTAVGASAIGQGLELNAGSLLTSRFLGVQTAVLNGSRNGVTLSIDPFDATVMVIPGIGATHFRNFVAINSVSAYQYDAIQGYYGADADADGIGSVVYGAFTSITDVAVGGQALVANLPGGVVPTASTGVFCWAGIEFYQQIGIQYYRLFLNDAGRVVLLG